MASNPVTNIRIDPELKGNANAVFEELGITLSTAVNMFLKAVVREGGMPFDIKIAKNSGSAGSTNQAVSIAQDEMSR